MKCPSCGYNSFDKLENCKRCGASLPSRSDSESVTFFHDIEPSAEAASGGEKTLFEEPENFRAGEDPLLLESEIKENDLSSYHIISKSLQNKGDVEKERVNYPGENILTLASLKRRTFAFILDVIVILLVSFLTLMLGLLAAGFDPVAGLINISYILLPVYIILSFLVSSYLIVLHAYSGKTIGKMVFGIRVVNEDGNTIGLSGSFVRWVGYFISALPLFYGYISAAFDFNLQTWHDKLSNSFVVKG